MVEKLLANITLMTGTPYEADVRVKEHNGECWTFIGFRDPSLNVRKVIHNKQVLGMAWVGPTGDDTAEAIKVATDYHKMLVDLCEVVAHAPAKYIR